MTTIETTADTVVKIKPIDSGILEKNQKCALPKGFKAILAPNVAARQVAGHTAVWLTDAVKVNDGKTTACTFPSDSRPAYFFTGHVKIEKNK